MVSGQEYEQYARRGCLEGLLAGELTADQAWERARGLDMELSARCYALAYFDLEPGADRLREAVLGYFLKYPQYILLRWSVGEYLVVIKADGGTLDAGIDGCVSALRAACEAHGRADWHMAVSGPAEALEALPGCYGELTRLWAHRFALPGAHVLTRETVGRETGGEDRLPELDPAGTDPQRFRELLEQGCAEEVPAFVSALLGELEAGLNCDSFCRYLALSARFTAARFAAERGSGPAEFLRDLPRGPRLTRQMLEADLNRVLREALRFRYAAGTDGCRGVLRQAAAYIDAHFSRESLSLNQVAEAVDLSPNYLSALFRRELDCTFVEYVTRKRMALAKKLLEDGTLRTGQVAAAVGYRDARYFSALFKKTQGMTPREYRASRKAADA